MVSQGFQSSLLVCTPRHPLAMHSKERKCRLVEERNAQRFIEFASIDIPDVTSLGETLDFIAS